MPYEWSIDEKLASTLSVTADENYVPSRLLIEEIQISSVCCLRQGKVRFLSTYEYV